MGSCTITNDIIQQGQDGTEENGYTVIPTVYGVASFGSDCFSIPIPQFPGFSGALALASLAAAPETAGFSLAGFGIGITNQVLGGLAAADGIALLDAAFNGTEGTQSTLGSAGTAIGGHIGGSVGEAANATIAVSAIGRGESLLGLKGNSAQLANAALAVAEALAPDLLRKPCQ
jgi:hypothetical protein